MGAIRRRVVFSPVDLERHNINLVGGDPYSGSCSPDQFFLWRPASGLSGHRTPIAGLYHIGASTHPGPGLHGASGLLVAKDLLGKRGWRRVLNAAVPLREEPVLPAEAASAD
jgi:phytoene dehydrogenase-like protein